MSVSEKQVQPNDSEQQGFLVENPRVFVDFHNADAQGHLRLNCIGTIEDLSAQKLELRAGQHLSLYSEDLEVNGIVEYSQSEHAWVVVIDWNEIKEIEEVNPVQKQLLNFEEKIRYIIEILESGIQSTSDIEQNIKPYKLEKSIDDAKRHLRNARAHFSREQDATQTLFYQQFAAIFGEEEATETWSARSWNTNIVLRDLAMVLMDEPELRQNIEQKGGNLEEIINIISQKDEVREILAELPQSDRSSLARLREVICA